ncbi:hypothetical protein [Microtetraspora glauca]|uniref:CPBP family intramembrane metalloprotease n=1 Tax=Microtetraspora glauca TaxID=1996 RepID=A0ABV3GQM4_MICGL
MKLLRPDPGDFVVNVSHLGSVARPGKLRSLRLRNYYGKISGERSSWWIAWWFLGTVAARLVIVWLYDGDGGSVLSAVVFHAMVNVTQSVLPGFTSNTLLVACTALVTTVLGVARLTMTPRRCSPSP